jgi:hypothetical protein
MANAIVNRQVNIYINSGEAQKALDKLIDREKKLKEELALATDPKRITALKNELAKLAEPIDRATKKLKGELLPTFKDLEQATRKWLNEFKRTGDPAALQNFKKFNDELQRQKAAISGLESAQKGLTKGGIFSGAFWGNLAAGAIQRVSSLITGMVGQSVKWALETEGVQRAFSRLNNPKLLDDLRKATRGTVSDLELMRAAVNANNFQIPLETLGTLLDFANRRARDTGQSVDFLVNSIVTGIARKSPLILDNLGINIKRINDEFAKTGDFAKAAFNVVNDELEKAGPALDTNADKVDRLKASWNNFWTEVGAGTVDFFDGLAKSAGRLFDPIGSAQKEANQKIAEENDRAFKFELNVMQDYKNKLSTADKAGRDQILQQVQTEIKLQEKYRKEAFDKGLTNQVNQFDRYIDLWEKFLKDIEEGGVATGGNTLTALESQLSLLQTQLKTLEIGSKRFKQTQVEIKKVQKEIDDANGRSGEEAARKARDAHKKILDDYKQLQRELRDLSEDTPDILPVDKEVLALEKKFEQLRELAHGSREKLKQIDEAYYRELFEIQLKFSRMELEEFERKEKEKEKRAQAMRDRLESRNIGTGTNDRFDAATIIGNADKIAKLQIELLQSFGRQKLQAQLALLDEEERQELEKAGQTETQKALIRAQFDERRAQIIADAALKEINFWKQQAEIVTALFSFFNQAAADRENAELERDRRINESKKANYDRQLKGKLITQLQYDREVRKLDKEQEKREKEVRLKQFQREKRAAIVQAIIDGALAVTQILKTVPKVLPGTVLPNPQFPIILATTIASNIAKIGLIASQKAPQFGGGGKLGGRKHSEGGNPILDGSGRKIAEIEAGEGIVNRKSMVDRKKYTVSGTPSQIASRINSLHGGVNWDQGAYLAPQWRTISPQRMNFSAMKKMYASGGPFENKTPVQPAPQDPPIDPAILINLTIAVEQLREQMKKPIKAYTLITDNEEQQKRLDDIRDDATLKA